MILSWLLTLPLAAAQSIPAEPMDPTKETVLFSIGEEIVQRINDIRANRNLPLLWKTEQHICAASLLSAHLDKTDTCTHRGPYQFPRVGDRMAVCGFPPAYYSEVVGCGFQTPSQVVDAWMKNPDHAKVLLSPLASEFGASYNNGKYVVVFSF